MMLENRKLIERHYKKKLRSYIQRMEFPKKPFFYYTASKW